MANRNISVRLQVDSGNFKAELVDAGNTGQEALQKIEAGANQASVALEKAATSSQKADREQQQLARSAERLKRQYADGYQSTQEQSRARDLVDKGLLSQNEYASIIEGIGRKYATSQTHVRSFGQAIEQQGERVRVTSAQMAALQPQLNDIFTTLTTGMSPLTIALQQGPQITQIFGGIGATFRAIPPVALATTAALAAVGIPLGIILSHASDLASQSRQFNVALASMGRQGEITAEQLGALVNKMRDMGVAKDEARSAITSLVKTPDLPVSEIPRLSGMIPDLAAAQGSTVTEAAKQLGDFAANGYEAIIKLDRALGGFLAPSQRENIRLLAQQGEGTKAYQIAVSALEVRIQGLNDQALSPTQKSITNIARAWDRLVESLAHGAIGRISLQVVEGVVTTAANIVSPGQPKTRDPVADAQDALLRTIERLERFNSETRLYRDQNSETMIPGFGYGSANAVRAQLETEVEAARKEFQRLADISARAQIQTQQLAEEAARAAASTPSATSQPGVREDTARQIADLEARRRLDNSTPAARPQIEAEIQAEIAARDRNLNAMEAEALKRSMMGNVIAEQKRQYADLTREMELQARTALDVANAYSTGQSAVMRAEALRIAQLENLRTGVDVAARTEEVLKGKVSETAEAQARAALQAKEAADSAKRIAGAEAGGPAAVARAQAAERALTATREARAALSNSTGDAEASLRKSIDETTKAIEAQSAAERSGQLLREQRIANSDLYIAKLEKEASTITDATERRARELAIERERRLQAQRDNFGATDPTLTATQDAAAQLREQTRYYNDIRDQAKSLSSDISTMLVDSFMNAGKSGKGVFSNLADGAVNLFKRVAAKIAATFLEQKFILPITTQITNAFPGLFGIVPPQSTSTSATETAAASSGGGLFDWIGNAFKGLFGSGHQGGLIGIAPSQTRTLAFATFDNAPRYHSGGMLGLRPDEIPFLGLKGEEVLTRDDPRHRWNLNQLNQNRAQPGNDVKINVFDMRINRDQPPARTEQKKGPDGQREISVFIEEKIEDAIRSGRLDRAQSDTYGTRRVTKRV